VAAPTSPVGALDAQRRPLNWLLAPMKAGDRALGVMCFGLLDENGTSPEQVALAQEVGRRAASALDRIRLYQNAQDAVRARDEFLSIASHELKTPITTLQLTTDVLLRQIFREHQSSSMMERAQHARRQVVRLVKLIDSLLDVSRISSGRMTMDVE